MNDRFMLKAWHLCDVFLCDLIEGRRNNMLDVRLREGEEPVKCISSHADSSTSGFRGMIAPPAGKPGRIYLARENSLRCLL